MELAEDAGNRLKEFMNLLTSEILQKYQTEIAAPSGILTCLKSLATEIPIPELQLILHVAEHQPVKKNLVIQTFTEDDLWGYSTVYRKLNKLVESGIMKDVDGKLTLAEKYAAISVLGQLQHVKMRE